jgi:hypothetical protein
MAMLHISPCQSRQMTIPYPLAEREEIVSNSPSTLRLRDTPMLGTAVLPQLENRGIVSFPSWVV